MHPKTREISEHMRDYGLSVLGRALVDVVFAEMMKPYAHATAVALAAHAAEILIKARIADEHPLLIFTKVPRSSTTPNELTVDELLVHGQTLGYAELPERLWATTGYRLRHADQFLAFGDPRNRVMHFAVPPVRLAPDVLRFIVEVMEPAIDDFWGASVLPHAETWDDVVAEGYLQEQLIRGKIKVPKKLRAALSEYWPKKST